MDVDALAGSLVGRAAELAELDAALDDAAGSESACVAIAGEPGIGKTRLLAELRRHAEERGCLVLAGTAAEFERDTPFSVWADVLDAYVAAQELELEADWPRETLAELGAILPTLRARDGPVRDTLPDERYRSHRAMRRLLERLAADRPLVLVLDDLHWADTASIELVGALLRRGADASILFAVAFRTSQADRLAAALAVPSLRRLTLGPLDEADSAELLGDAGPAAAAEYFRQCGGNPFYLEQLARAPAPEAAGELSIGVPAAVAASLAEELAALSGPERALLQAAAVAGEPFDPDVAAAVAQLDPAEALTALDTLLALDLARTTRVPRRFAFRHPIVRRAVYESTPGGWRLAAHARAVATLAARGAPPTDQAHHVEQSAGPGDEASIELLLAAGDAAINRAPGSAARWYEAALRLLPAADRERQVEVRVELAGALRALGDLERCRAILLETIELLGTDAAETQRRIDLTVLCATVEHWLGRHEDAHRRLDRAWEELPDRTSATAVALQVELAVDGFYKHDLEQTLAMGRGGHAIAREAGDPVLHAAAAAALALGEVAAGEVEQAREHRAEASALYDRLTDAELGSRLDGLYHLAWAETYLEHYGAAIARADRGIAIARATGNGRSIVPLMLTKGYPLEMQGRLAEALEITEAAVEATHLARNPHHRFWALFELAFARYYVGDLEGVIAAGEESARVGGRLAGGTMPAAGGGPGWILAMARFEAGDVERARSEMYALGPIELPHKIPVERCFDWEILALVELALGRVEAADAIAARSEAHAAGLSLGLPRCLALRTRASVLLAQGDAAGAAALAAESAEVAKGIGARLIAAYSVAVQGRALAEAGDRKQAVKVLRTAESEVSACGSLRVRDQVRRDLRKLGARAEVRGPATGELSGVGALTRREREIADLVTDRKTNREIAGALFLSDKTVESHLRNIFVKLGVSSRVEVARAVERSVREGEDSRS